MLMKILEKWSHCNSVWFLTALLFCAVAICSPYSHISVIWDIKRGKLGSGSLIHSCTALHFMACWPEIPYRDIFFTELYDSFCMLLGCCFSSQTLRHSCHHFPPVGPIYSLCFLHLSNYVTKTRSLYYRICTLGQLDYILWEFPSCVGWVDKIYFV